MRYFNIIDNGVAKEVPDCCFGITYEIGIRDVKDISLPCDEEGVLLATDLFCDRNIESENRLRCYNISKMVDMFNAEQAAGKIKAVRTIDGEICSEFRSYAICLVNLMYGKNYFKTLDDYKRQISMMEEGLVYGDKLNFLLTNSQKDDEVSAIVWINNCPDKQMANSFLIGKNSKKRSLVFLRKLG